MLSKHSLDGGKFFAQIPFAQMAFSQITFAQLTFD
jgi:hypothetical protein